MADGVKQVSVRKYYKAKKKKDKLSPKKLMHTKHYNS